MERYDFTTKRLFVEDELSADLSIHLNRVHSNYLLNVMRMKAHDKILLFNGRQGEWLGEIVIAGKKSCEVKLISQTRLQPDPYDLTYYFAPLKKGRLDYMVQKAVEMGAGVLQPVFTQYTQIHKLNIERLKAYGLEAAEQCGILSVPKINPPIKFAEIFENWDEAHALIYADETAENDNMVHHLKKLKDKKPALLIGPEGGFSEAERLQLKNTPWVYPVSLGPRILRADTAAVAALAVLQASIGDWNS